MVQPLGVQQRVIVPGHVRADATSFVEVQSGLTHRN
jgi:hypothetical protein